MQTIPGFWWVERIELSAESTSGLLRSAGLSANDRRRGNMLLSAVRHALGQYRPMQEALAATPRPTAQAEAAARVADLAERLLTEMESLDGETLDALDQHGPHEQEELIAILHRTVNRAYAVITDARGVSSKGAPSNFPRKHVVRLLARAFYLFGDLEQGELDEFISEACRVIDLQLPRNRAHLKPLLPDDDERDALLAERRSLLDRRA